MKVIVINYGMGNLGSVRRAFEECGGAVTVSEKPEDLKMADRIVLPGVGAFADGMRHLREHGWEEPLRETLQNPQVRLIGICLGMQLLAESGEEGGETKGLGYIPGKVMRLRSPDPHTRIPHVGWNEIHFKGHCPLFQGIESGTDFYFVHSYHLTNAPKDAVLATTPYAGEFASVIGKDNVFGTQFHPEKSSRPGFQLIRNFLFHF